MSGLEVQTGEVDAAAALVSSAVADGRAELDRLRRCAADVVGGGWRGEAGAAFSVGWHDWVDGAVQVLGALDDLGRLLFAAGGRYDADEVAVRASFDGAAA